MSNLHKALAAFPKIPRAKPGQSPYCVICGCTENAACPGGCSWVTFDLEGEWGLCSACEDNVLCMTAVTLVSYALDGDRWKRRRSCPCPLCKKKPTRRKK